jgi:pilus assembly protein Flp/PilA
MRPGYSPTQIESIRRNRGDIMKNLFARFINEEEGQDLIEYALLAALISVVAFVMVQNIGTGVKTLFTNVNTQVQSAS